MLTNRKRIEELEDSVDLNEQRLDGLHDRLMELEDEVHELTKMLYDAIKEVKKSVASTEV